MKEPEEPSPSQRRPLRFKPKVPPKKALAPKNNHGEVRDNVVDNELLMKLRAFKSSDGLAKQKSEKEVSDEEDALVVSSSGNAKAKKNNAEPWDYITLPLRRPNSEKEKSADASAGICPKDPPTTAEELGLMEPGKEPQLIFFQLPASLPLLASQDGEGKVDDLPSGLLGKIVVYQSGKVKMKIGDALFDVSAGVDCSFAQDAAIVDLEEKQLAVLGPVAKCAVVTPDIDHLLKGM